MYYLSVILFFVISAPSWGQEEESLEELIKKNTLVEIYDDKTPITSDVAKLEIQTGAAQSSQSSAGQYLLKIDAYAEHFNEAEQSTRYFNLDFVYLQGDKQNKLAIKITPIEIGLKNYPQTDDEIFIGALPLSTGHDDFLLNNDYFKMSLIASEMSKTIPIGLATLILKGQLDLLGFEFLKRQDQYQEGRRLEIFNGSIDLNVKINNIFSLYLEIGQSMYLNDFKTVFNKWAGQSKIGVGAEFGFKVGDLHALFYYGVGYKKQDQRGEVTVEMGIKLSDVFATSSKKGKK